MKTIRTTSGSFLTGSEIADAVTAYALALARARELDVVDIPFVTHDGSINRAEFRIGWLIETVVTADGQPATELMEVDTIFDLLAKASSVTASRVPRETSRWTVVRDDADWDEFI
jgi:hypothetical protein